MSHEQFKGLLGGHDDGQSRPGPEEIEAYFENRMDPDSRAEFEAYLSFNDDFRREVADLMEQAQLEAIELAAGRYQLADKSPGLARKAKAINWTVLFGFGMTAAACVLVGLYLGRASDPSDNRASESVARRESAIEAEEKRLQDERLKLEALRRELDSKSTSEGQKEGQNEVEPEGGTETQSMPQPVRPRPRQDASTGRPPRNEGSNSPVVRPSDLLAMAAQMMPVNPAWIASSVRGGSGFGPWGAQRTDTLALQWKPEDWMASAVVKVQDAESLKVISIELRLDRDSIQSGKLTLGEAALGSNNWLLVTMTVSADPEQERTQIRSFSLLARRLNASERGLLAKQEAHLNRTFASNPVVLGRSLARLRAAYGLASELPQTLEGAYPSLAEDQSSQREYHRELGELMEGMGFVNLALREYRLAQRLGDDSRPLQEAIQRCNSAGSDSEADADQVTKQISETTE